MQLSNNNQLSIAKYRARAANYDASCGPTQPIRAKTIALLGLQSGDTVLDVGCGTGMSFAPLLQHVGPTGRVLAFEQSPEMFAQAAARVHDMGWSNVQLLQTTAENYQAPCPAHEIDAVLMHYVHDISRIDAAIDNLFKALRPGTRVAMAGMKYFGPGLSWLNGLARMKNRPYNVLYKDLHAPWDKVQRYVPNLQCEATQFGMGYIAHGHVAA
jgi:arsenite methyltransferase